MEEIIFFKSDTTEARGFCTTPDGKIDFRGLGLSMGLEPGSIELRGVTLPFDSNLHSLSTWTQIKMILGVEGTFENPVVVSGRPAVPTVPTDGANRISLSERTKCEFDFEVMNTWKPGVALNTVEIAETMKDYGGFPSLYYVRLEETMVFRKCQELLTAQRRVVLLGSPGVGKSVFLVLFAFYLAHVKSKSVILLRRVKGGYPKPEFALVHVCREGYSGATFNQLTGFPGRFDHPAQSFMFFDGFNQSDVDSIQNSLGSFNLLATSSQYDLKSDDFITRCVLLPAWLPEDLRAYAVSAKICRSEEPFNEEAYSYSGGSLPFNVVENAISRISDPGNLLRLHGAGTKEQVDTIRKLFVKDRNEAEDYDTIAQWVPTVDSRIV